MLILDLFQAGDQFNLNIQAHDGQYHSKTEVYGRIEEARNRTAEELEPLPPLPSTTRATTTSALPTSSPTSPNSTRLQGDPTVDNGEGKVRNMSTMFNSIHF